MSQNAFIHQVYIVYFPLYSSYFRYMVQSRPQCYAFMSENSAKQKWIPSHPTTPLHHNPFLRSTREIFCLGNQNKHSQNQKTHGLLCDSKWIPSLSNNGKGVRSTITAPPLSSLPNIIPIVSDIFTMQVQDSIVTSSKFKVSSLYNKYISSRTLSFSLPSLSSHHFVGYAAQITIR